MTYKYTPLITQTPPDPVTNSESVSIWNVADSSNVLQLCNNILPSCTIWKNGDRTGSFEYYEPFITNNYKSVIAGSTGTWTYSSANRTLTGTAGSTLWFAFDAGASVTGIPFVQALVNSGAPQFSVSEDGTTWYDIDGNDTTSLTDTVIYRELDNIANCRMKGNVVFYVKINAGAAQCVLGLLRIYADTINSFVVFPKIFATGQPNTFSVILNGNPKDIAIRYRDAKMVI
jgi:hypothetical protein